MIDKLEKESNRKFQEKLDRIIEPLIEEILLRIKEKNSLDEANLYKLFAVGVLEGCKLAEQVNDKLDKVLEGHAKRIVEIEERKDLEDRLGMRPNSKDQEVKDAVAIMNINSPLVDGQPRFYIPSTIKKGVKQ